MQIAGLQKTTLIDYPGHVAATIFTRGCSFRCPYCHNPELVLPKQFAPLISEDEIWEFLSKRQGKLDGVCITGGEPTLHADLLQFIKHIKGLGFLVKLDTNGTYPNRLQEIIEQNLVDYIAMDIKGPLDSYQSISHARANPSGRLVPIIQTSIALIMRSGIDYEFRTTVAKPLLNLADIVGIGLAIKGAKRHFLQNYVASKQVDVQRSFKPFSASEMSDAASIMSHWVEHAAVR